jgi:tetraacyldisaccharide 4'-kinase
VLILDDAFQHRRMARNFDLVLLDALNPYGFGHMLPRGLLREPVASLKRAHAVALSRADAIAPFEREAIRRRVAEVAPQALWLELEHRPASLVQHGGAENAIEQLESRRIAAFCGIGNPAGFLHTLESCNAKVIAQREFLDHFAYSPADLAGLENWVQSQSADAEWVVCTHKDLVKIPRDDLAGKPLWAIKIEAAIRVGQSALEQRLQQLLDLQP